MYIISHGFRNTFYNVRDIDKTTSVVHIQVGADSLSIIFPISSCQVSGNDIRVTPFLRF